MAPQLAEYLERMGFTHVEFLPLTEHPFYGSWGYQTTGYLRRPAATVRPQDLMYLIDYLHQHGIGVILDWVPSHFPTDEHGRWVISTARIFTNMPIRDKAIHPDWDSYIFNYGRHEVRSFLLRSALFWLDQYHIDGLRVDAVASMLYLDYSRKRANGFPTNTAAAKISRRSTSCDDSTRKSIANIPTSRRLPKNRRPGRWFRGRPMSADWASVSNGTWAGCTTH